MLNHVRSRYGRICQVKSDWVMLGQFNPGYFILCKVRNFQAML
jgi:hypothetical protein